MLEHAHGLEQKGVRDAKTLYPATSVDAKADKLPPGYKRTEAGVIPEDWDVCRIEKHASISTGEKNTQDKVDDGRYPFFVRSQNVERINSCSFEGEAVLTAGDGVGTGKIFHYINGRFDVHQRVYRISDFSPSMDGKYFFYQFSSRFYARIMAMTAKSSVDSVRRDMIASMPIPFPSLSEQRAIATALSDVDALIDSLDRLIAKKRDIKQATMQQLLTGKTRLPGFEGEWETKALGEIATFHKGVGLGKSDLVFDGQKKAIHYGELFTHYGEYIASVTSTTNLKIHPVVSEENDVLMPTSDVTPNGLSKASCITISGVVLGGDILIIRPQKNVLDGTFLAYKIRSEHRQIMGLVSGTTVFHIYGRDMAKFELDLPSSYEQKAIVNCLSDMDAEIEALERRCDKTKQIKQGMMQELLTGRVRLV